MRHGVLQLRIRGRRASPGQLIEAAGEVVRRTRSLTFVRGQIFTGDRVLMNYSAIVKRIPGGRPPAAG